MSSNEEKLKFIHPAAVFASTVAKEVVQSDSEELKMMKEIYAKLTNRFDSFKYKIDYYMKISGGIIQMTRYTLNIQSYAEEIKRHLNILLYTPTGTREEIGHYIRLCQDPKISPWNLLSRINKMINCDKTLHKTISLYFNFIELFEILVEALDETILDRQDLFNLFLIGKGWRGLVTSSNSTESFLNIRQTIKEKKIRFNDLQEVDAFILQQVKEESMSELENANCFIDTFIAINKFYTESALHFALYVKRDIEMVFIAESFCLRFLYPDENTRKIHSDKLADLYSSASSTAFKRTINLIDASWPGVDINEVKIVMRDIS